MCIFPCTFPESGFVLLGFVSIGTISRQCIVSLWRLGHWCQVVPQWCVGAYLSLLRQPVLLSSLCLWLPSPSFHRLHLSFHPLCVLEHWVAIYFTQIVKFLCSDLFLVSVVSLAEPARTVSCSVFYVFTLLLSLSLFFYFSTVFYITRLAVLNPENDLFLTLTGSFLSRPNKTVLICTRIVVLKS